jgi:hypothetical protein
MSTIIGQTAREKALQIENASFMKRIKMERKSASKKDENEWRMQHSSEDKKS